MDEKGQVLVEFVFCIIIFALFIFGLIGVTTWGAASYFAQEAAHEAARKYAVTYDKSKAEKMGLDVLNKWAYIFIDTSSSSVDVAARGTKAVSTVVVKPKESMQKLFVFTMPKITKTSEATFEHYIRNPNDYVGGRGI
jgi:Flp pilus assembly protein TadG